jgi:5'-nucleotidase
VLCRVGISRVFRGPVRYNGNKTEAGAELDGGNVHILVTNDDGISAPGLAALAAAARQLGQVTIVAPEREASGVSHAVTLIDPIPCRRLPDEDSMVRYALDATPADCVKLAVTELAEHPIDLVLSGVNPGANVGVAVLYSGTVAAALEASMCGLPAAAVSLADSFGVTDRAPFDRAAEIALGVVRDLLRRGLVTAGAPLNVNVPRIQAGWPLGWRVARQSLAAYDDRFDGADDPRVYRIARGETRREDDHETDLVLVARGYVTVTPLSFDLTDHRTLGHLQRHIEPEGR